MDNAMMWYVVLALGCAEEIGGRKALPIRVSAEVDPLAMETRPPDARRVSLEIESSPSVRREIEVLWSPDHPRIQLAGCGHASLFPGHAVGDVVVEFVERSELAEIWSRDEVLGTRELHATVPITLYDYIYGGSFRIRSPHCPHQTYLQVAYEPGTRTQLLPGAGLWDDALGARADGYAFFELQLPSLERNPLLRSLVARAFVATVFGEKMFP